MKIEYFEPVFRAWDRMLKMLFKPFDLALWLSLGFSAWMASLFDGYSNPFSFRFILPSQNPKMEKIFESFSHFKTQSLESINIFSKAASELSNADGSSGKEGLLYIVTFVVIFVVVIVIITLVLRFVAFWLKSVFEIIFIDHLLSDQFSLSESWKKYHSLGTSAFVWRIFFYLIVGFISLVILAVAGVICIPWIKSCWEARAFLCPDLSISIASGFFVFLSLLLSFFSWCVNIVFRQFIIALMYKNEVGAIEAWSIFFNLTRHRRFEIVKFLFFWTGLKILAWMAVMIISVLTCCLLWIFLIFPYIWAVAVLPVLVFFRFYSLEFLSQFGDSEFNFFEPL